MESPHLAGQWRRDPEARAESTVNLSRDATARPQALSDEVTESQPVAARRGSEDAAEQTSKVADGKQRDSRPPIARRPVPREITHPLARLRRASDVRLADGESSPSELVRLVLPEQRQRHADSVSAGDLLADRYQVLERVARSGMGLVCKALDRRREQAGSLQPWVALKFARGSDTDGSETAAHLRQEFLNLSQLSHPNIVSVFDFAHDGGLDFLVLEWLEGETLAELLGRINSKRIALDKAEEIVRSIASALAYAHGLGLVHGDVKPANIFLTSTRAIKLLDFGSSPPGGASGEGNWATRAYASPEVLEGTAPLASDDVHALAVTAYCLLSGERPFGELDAREAFEQGIVPLPLPADARERWPAVERALKPHAAARPANASEFLREFDDPLPEVAEPQDGTPASHVAYGAIALGLLIAMIAWTVGTISGLPADVEDLLADGQRAFDQGQLVQPAGQSAFAYFSSVLEVAPGNAEARNGLQRIADAYLTEARESLADGDRRGAVENLEVARRVVPDYFGVVVTGELIARYGRDLLRAAGDLADEDPEQAEATLDRAAELLPAGDAQVASVRRAILQVKREREVEGLLRRIDERILGERLLVPQGDSAVELLQEARRLAPDDRQVALAADRIATALLFQSMFAVSNGKLDDAGRFLNAARALGVRHMALARAEYELARARHEALLARRAAGNRESAR